MPFYKIVELLNDSNEFPKITQMWRCVCLHAFCLHKMRMAIYVRIYFLHLDVYFSCDFVIVHISRISNSASMWINFVCMCANGFEHQHKMKATEMRFNWFIASLVRWKIWLLLLLRLHSWALFYFISFKLSFFGCWILSACT